jgi:hypothetical protein
LRTAPAEDKDLPPRRGDEDGRTQEKEAREAGMGSRAGEDRDRLVRRSLGRG